MEDADWMKPLVKIGLVLLVCALSAVWYWFKFSRVGSKLTKAIVGGDVAALQTMVKKYRNLLTEDDFEALTGFLTLAVAENQHECLKVLLELGDAAHLQERTLEEDDVALLQLAVEHGSAEMLRTMLAAGMKPAAEPESPWMHCYVRGSVEHARVLREFGGDVMTPEQLEDLEGETPLHAVVYGWYYNPAESAAMLRYLLQECGEDPNAQSIAGNTPLDLACDETHVGYEGSDELRRLLTETGGKRGRNLRVPVPSYSGRVLVKGELPDVSSIAASVSAGVTVMPHAEPWNPVALRESLKESPLKDDVVDQLLSHSCYVEVAVQGSDGEDPVAVAQRAMVPLRLLETMPGVVGVQFQSFIGSSFKGEPGELMPFNLIGVALGRTEEGAYLLATQGMVDYGLPEVEISVPEVMVQKWNITPFAPLGDVLYQLMRGTTAFEPGHSATLLGRFHTTIDWGKLRTTGAIGFCCEMSTDPTPEHMLHP